MATKSVFDLGVERGVATGRREPTERDFEWLAERGEWDLTGVTDPQVGVDFEAGMAKGVATERFVVTAEWPNKEREEVDVDVTDGRAGARRAAEKELAEGYEPGWKIVRVAGPKVGLYL